MKKYLILLLLLTNVAFSTELRTSCFKISGMQCSSCKNKIKEKLLKNIEIKSVEISLLKGTAVVEYSAGKIDEKTITDLIKITGYQNEKIECLK
jgi:copper chaperone CopZ